MKLLLPPSEGKSFGKLSTPLALQQLSFPDLNQDRQKVIDQLLKTSKSRTAIDVLGLTEGLKNEITHNREILTAKTSPAIEIYEGVVYQNIDFKSLSIGAKRNFNNQVLIISSVFGALQPQDLIPHYRLSGSVSLPKIGVVSSFWSNKLDSLFDSDELIVDCRSGTYEKFWKPNSEHNYLRIKVMQYDKAKGQKLAVSHFNKATKGLITRALVSSKVKIRQVDQAADELAKAGWDVELTGQISALTLEVLMK